MNIALVTLYGIENIGIRQIAAGLKKEGFKASTIFFKKWVNNNIGLPSARELLILEGLLKEIKPDIIGIGFGSPYLKIAREVSNSVFRKFNALIVAGGIHPTISPEDCIDFADVVCVGEGEAPMLELAQKISAKQGYHDIKNLWVKTASAVYKNPIRDLIQNLDDLPYPDYDSNDKYFIEDNFMKAGEPLRDSAEVRVCASRGCFFNCSYCYNSTLRRIYEGKGSYHRRHSVKYMLGLLKYCRDNMPRVRRVKFDDDTFLFPDDWMNDFCVQYKKDIGIPFEILLNPDIIRRNSLEKLKKAGLVKVQLGIESASGKAMDKLYNRAGSDEEIIKFSKINKELRLEAVYDIILDNPLMTSSDKDNLVKLLLNIQRPFKIYLYSLTCFPKTALTQELLDKGLITEQDVEGRNTKSFRQFRLSFNYPRSQEDIFYISIITLTSKGFIPKWLIRAFYRSKYLKRHALLLSLFSRFANFIKICLIACELFFKGELTRIKFKEYARLDNLLIQ